MKIEEGIKNYVKSLSLKELREEKSNLEEMFKKIGRDNTKDFKGANPFYDMIIRELKERKRT